MTGTLGLSDIDFFLRLKNEEGFFARTGGTGGRSSFCDWDPGCWFLGMVLVWLAMLLLLFGVVRGRVWEYMESMSGNVCFPEAGDSMGEECDALDVLESCGCDLDELPPPNTRLKKPGLSLGVGAGDCDGNKAFRVLMLGLGADGSCNDGTGGRSRNVLALTNSCACALMFGSSALLFFRSVL
jgi:hypothetical protein